MNRYIVIKFIDTIQLDKITTSIICLHSQSPAHLLTWYALPQSLVYYSQTLVYHLNHFDYTECLGCFLIGSFTYSTPPSLAHCINHLCTASVTCSLPQTLAHYLRHLLTTSDTCSLPQTLAHYFSHLLIASATCCQSLAK